jgi:hypothetical protein
MMNKIAVKAKRKTLFSSWEAHPKPSVTFLYPKIRIFKQVNIWWRVWNFQTFIYLMDFNNSTELAANMTTNKFVHLPFFSPPKSIYSCFISRNISQARLFFFFSSAPGWRCKNPIIKGDLYLGGWRKEREPSAGVAKHPLLHRNIYKFVDRSAAATLRDWILLLLGWNLRLPHAAISPHT